jgi:hypothetical protein
MSWFVNGLYYGLCGLGALTSFCAGVFVLGALVYGIAAIFGGREDDDR